VEVAAAGGHNIIILGPPGFKENRLSLSDCLPFYRRRMPMNIFKYYRFITAAGIPVQDKNQNGDALFDRRIIPSVISD
jgi:hypothetical protein